MERPELSVNLSGIDAEVATAAEGTTVEQLADAAVVAVADLIVGEVDRE